MAAIEGITQHTQPTDIRRVDSGILANWLSHMPNVEIVDVREEHEWSSGRIPGAILAPLRQIFELGADRLRDRSATVVVYCESGVRSLRAAQYFTAGGYEAVYSLDGGFAAWKRAGYPVERAQAAVGAFALNDEQLERYSRNVRLPQIGEIGQRQLLASRVLIVGVGGLGTPAALYLAAAGVGTLGLVDDDCVELSNLQRQVLHSTSRIGMAKVESAAQAVTDLNRDVTTIQIRQRLEESNVHEVLAQGWDVIIDGSDNYTTRYTINDACCTRGIPVVYGSVQGFEGRIMTVVPGNGPCYRCAFSTPPPEEIACSCDSAGVLGVLPGTIGVLQATEAIKLVTKVGKPLVGRMLHYDALEMQFYTMKVPRTDDCPACATARSNSG